MNLRPRTTPAAALAALLVLGAAAGGLAYTKVLVDGADRTAAPTVWKKPKHTPSDGDPVPSLADGRRDNALSRELLPVPARHRLGPAMSEFGNDAYLSGRKARALLASGASGLPDEARKKHRRLVDDLEVQGMAMRSYSHLADELVVEIQLARMNNEEAVKDLAGLQTKLVEALSVFRKGPEIDGYRDAKCFLMPEADGEDGEVEEMFCTASEDDVLVSLTATGVDPLDEEEVAELLTAQLDRLTEGGGTRA